MSALSDSRPEFSRVVDSGGVGPAPERHDVVAEAGECEALARRFGLESLDRLSATVTLTRVSGGQVRLVGRLSAGLAQNCVVSLEPVAQTVEEEFSLFYAEPAEAADAWDARDARDGKGGQIRGGEVDVGLDDEASPEPLTDGCIDIGEAVAQQLALALDPYPRAPGAELHAVDADDRTEAAPPNPFGVLEGLRKP